MNFPNALTVLRIILTFFFIFFILKIGFVSKVIAGIIFICASISDYFDGYYARKHNLITSFGKIMDPIADKFLVLSAFFVFSRLQLIPFWMFLIIFVREFSITAIRLRAMMRGQILAAEKLGKYKTVIQIVTIIICLIFLIILETSLMDNISHSLMGYWIKFIYVLSCMTVAITMISGVSFLRNNRQQIVKI